MKDRRKTRLRSDLRHGDLVTRSRNGWFVPVGSSEDCTGNPWGMYDKNRGLVPEKLLSFSEARELIPPDIKLIRSKKNEMR